MFGPLYINVCLQLTFESRKQGDPKKRDERFSALIFLINDLKSAVEKVLNFRREYIYSFLSSDPSISCKTLSKICGFTTSISINIFD